MHARKHETTMSNDARIAVLETTLQNINLTLLDIRQDMHRLSDKIDTKIDTLDKKIDSKIDALDKKFESKIDALDKKIDSKIDALDKKIDLKIDTLDRKFETRFNMLDTRINTLDSRLWNNFIWTIGIAIGLASLIAHAQHWI